MPPEPSPEVLYEDNHLLVVNKPAGLPTMGVAAGDLSLVVWAKQYLKQKYQKPGNVYLGVVSRLDALVSGVLVLARTSKAAARLTRQFHDRSVSKRYWAWVPAGLEPDTGTWTDWLRKDDKHRRVCVCPGEHSLAKQARLHYQVQRRTRQGTLLEIDLETGRKHQIRVQCAAHGFPIWGDAKYGSQVRFPRGIALHARHLVLEHPVRKSPIAITAPTPAYWPN